MAAARDFALTGIHTRNTQDVPRPENRDKHPHDGFPSIPHPPRQIRLCVLCLFSVCRGGWFRFQRMRIRTIKPEFWKNPDLAKLSADTRLLALALLNYADDEGYFLADPVVIRGELFPFTESSVSIQLGLTHLSNADYLHLYTGRNGRTYGLVVNFKKHQWLNRPTASKLKDYIDLTADSQSPQLQLNDDSLTEQGSGNREKEQGRSEPVAPVVVELQYPNELNTEAFRASWDHYLTYRRERKLAKLKPTSVTTQFKEMAGWGSEAAIAAIRETIRNGWTGIFEPKGKGPNARPVRTEALITKI